MITNAVANSVLVKLNKFAPSNAYQLQEYSGGEKVVLTDLGGVLGNKPLLTFNNIL